MPAIDILEVKKNEYLDAKCRNFNIMCAASGDLRNVVKTIGGLPDGYAGKCSILMNDNDFDIVARNVILLMIALYFDTDDAVPAMIHLWYSARLPAAMMKGIQEMLLPLIDDVCSKIVNKPDNVPLGKTFKIEAGQSIRIVLTKSDWFRFKGYFSLPTNHTPEKAEELRIKAVYDPTRHDYHHKGLYTYWPALRMSMHRFRTDGLLLPYRTSRKAFDTWNPTFLQTPEKWPMRDDVEPHIGWSHEDIMSGKPTASGDYLGAQFFMLRDLLNKFCNRVKTFDLKFRSYYLDARDLPMRLTNWKEEVGLYDRIEVRAQAAVLMLLFQTAVPEIDNYRPPGELQQELREVLAPRMMAKRYLPFPKPKDTFEQQWHPNIDRFEGGARMLRDFEVRFDVFMAAMGLKGMLAQAGLKMRTVQEHKVTRAWPKRMTRGGSKEEFTLRLAKCYKPGANDT
jgi:hypothetical protein